MILDHALALTTFIVSSAGIISIAYILISIADIRRRYFNEFDDFMFHVDRIEAKILEIEKKEELEKVAASNASVAYNPSGDFDLKGRGKYDEIYSNNEDHKEDPYD